MRKELKIRRECPKRTVILERKATYDEVCEKDQCHIKRILHWSKREMHRYRSIRHDPVAYAARLRDHYAFGAFRHNGVLPDQ